MVFGENGIVYLNQSSIIGQTFHWHDELELLIVVEGSLDLKVGYEWFRLRAGDIMLINSDEIHSMKETNEKNVVVFLYVDCNAIYEKYPDFYEIMAFWPYSEAFDKINQKKHTIMDHVNRLAVLIDQNARKERILHQLDSLLMSLIYCYRLDITDINGAVFQGTDEKMDMIYRTIKYLYSNYDHKVNLQEISEQEYLSLFYLSHKFKDITGYSFRDWLNFVRVEKAEKLLLDTPLPITEIAYQCGFSDVRYFNKHFTKWYKISPNKYRKLFSESYKMHCAQESLEADVSMAEIISKIESIAPEMKPELDPKSKIVIDLKSEKVVERLDPSWKEKLWCGSANIIGYRKLKQIKDVQKEIGFTAITADELFGLEIQQAEDGSILEVHRILNFMLDRFEKVCLVVRCSKNDQYEIDTAEELLQSFFEIYPKGRAAQIEFKLDIADKEQETKEKIKAFAVFLDAIKIRHSLYEEPTEQSDSLEIDYIRNMINGEIRMDWLYSKNNLYYLYFFLSHMGQDVIAKETSYVITRKKDDLQILFHNGDSKFKYPQETQYKLILKNLSGNYKVVHYTWNSEKDDISSIIKNPKVIRHLSNCEYEMINNASVPMVSVDYIDGERRKNKAFELNMPVPATSMQLTLLIKL